MTMLMTTAIVFSVRLSMQVESNNIHTDNIIERKSIMYLNLKGTSLCTVL